MHFVVPAIQMFGKGWNAALYDQTNPAALAWLLHFVFALRFGTGNQAANALAANLATVLETARRCSRAPTRAS